MSADTSACISAHTSVDVSPDILGDVCRYIGIYICRYIGGYIPRYFGRCVQNLQLCPADTSADMSADTSADVFADLSSTIAPCGVPLGTSHVGQSQVTSFTAGQLPIFAGVLGTNVLATYDKNHLSQEAAFYLWRKEILKGIFVCIYTYIHIYIYIYIYVCTYICICTSLYISTPHGSGLSRTLLREILGPGVYLFYVDGPSIEKTVQGSP